MQNTRNRARWTSFGDEWGGGVRDNCFNNTMAVHKVLADRRFDAGIPLYVAAHWPAVQKGVAESLLRDIAAAGYNVVRAPAPAGEREAALPREVAALFEYELALRAERFLGNSVSTFSALAILERRRGSRWAGYYNGGNIPLASFIPLYSTPWVFTFNSWSPGYEILLKAAVNSAAAAGRVKGHSMFAGDDSAPIAGWLRAKGVTVMPHDPAWAPRLLALANASHLGESHLFKSNETLLATWQRIDLPLMTDLDQYTYVLFTDTDIVFRRPFSLSELPLPLPKSVGMGPEQVSAFPYNAGVMIANLPALRASYGAFLEFVLSNKQGLVFEGFGPGDQVRAVV